MTPEQLQAALNALMEAGLDGDALTAATKALTDAFGANVEVSDDAATDAMPPDMAASFRAADTSAEDKAVLLNTSKHFLRQAKLAEVPAMVEKAKLSAKGGKEGAKMAGFSAADLEAAVTKAVTKAMPGQGRPAVAPANPVKGSVPAGAAGFSAKIQTLQTAGVGRAVAIQTLAQSDRAGFNEWSKAGRPVA